RWLVGKLRPEMIPPGIVLNEDHRYWLVEMSESDADAAKSAGFQLKPVFQTRSEPRASVWNASWRPDSNVARLVAQVSLDSLARDIRRLQNFRTRHTLRDSCDSCAFWLYRRFAGYGCSTEFDRYRYQNNLCFNVIATIPGEVRPESIVVMCGHFDSYSPTPDNAPGADDNATGTAILLEATRLFQNARFRWSVKLVGFSGEEQWMKGSYHWVDSVVVPQQLKIDGVYNVDMIGYTSADSTYHVVNYNSPSIALAGLCDSVNRWYSIGLDQLLLYYDPDCAGDNTPFWERGFRAVFALEDSEWGIWNGSNPHYHTTHDTFGTLRLGQVRRVAQMCIAALATHAGLIDYVGADESRPETALQPWRIRPNPFVNQTRIWGREDDLWEVLDISGRPVSRERGRTIGSRLLPGVYFLKALDTPFSVARIVKLR
ncbi:MAG: M28 family peptidase, partial [candidate division WOR-3 bacterium]